MLQQTSPLPTRPLFSLQIVSTTLSYSKHSFSFKSQSPYSYLCLKTQPLKFSILIFQSNCLSNVRSFSLKTTSNRQICFLNLEYKNAATGSSEEEYEILVGYQTGEFDIYSIVGNNAKLIEASKETQIPRRQFLEVVYQHHYNQIIIINKNVLTSIEITYPFRLKREQEIEGIESCEVSKINNTLVTGGKKGINVYQVANFSKIKFINVQCDVLRMSLMGGYYVGFGGVFSWIDEEGNVKCKYEKEGGINNVVTNKDTLWIVFNQGEVGCLEQKNRRGVVVKKRELGIEEQSNNHSKELSNSYSGQKQQNKSQQLEFSRSKDLQFDVMEIKNQSIKEEQSFIDQLQQLKISNCNGDENRQFSKLTKIETKSVVSVKIIDNLIVILEETGVLAIRQIIRK